MKKKSLLVMVLAGLAVWLPALAQRQNDRLWTDPRSLTILMYYSPALWPTLKGPEGQPLPNFPSLVGSVTTSSITVSPFEIQRPTYQDYREFLFNRPLPGIRQYGLSSEISAQMLPYLVLPLSPPQPIDLSKRLYTSPH